jgi:D-sedoheptulose 7-phosphate isomerase
MRKIIEQEIQTLVSRYPQLKTCENSLSIGIEALAQTYQSGGKVLIMGNGGSSADAEHITGELLKGFVSKRKLSPPEASKYQKIDPILASFLQGGLPTISLGVAHAFNSAFCNDVDAKYLFAQQVHVLANANDLVWAITTSGNSANVIEGLKVAKAKGVKTLGLTGIKPSKASELCDTCIQAPAELTHHIQELHLPIYHCICLALENIFFPN